jgi:hypothetical protein
MNERTINCALCGKRIEGKPSKDHCHPRAIYKWLEELLDEEAYREVKNLVDSQDNIIFTHDSCNKEKEDFIVDIDKLYLPNHKKQAVANVHSKIRPYQEMYFDLKTRIYNKQSCKCYNCGCEIENNNGVIRRIDCDYPRYEENACIVCHSCNVHCAKFV